MRSSPKIACFAILVRTSTVAVTRLIASWARSRLLILTLISANCRPRGVGQWWAGPMGTGRPGEPPTYAGTDFIIARDGWIAALYPFFDKLPWARFCRAPSYS